VAVFFTYAGRVTADTSIAVTPVAIEDAHRAIVEPINATREARAAAKTTETVSESIAGDYDIVWQQSKPWQRRRRQPMTLLRTKV
jgi:hypothetical protein